MLIAQITDTHVIAGGAFAFGGRVDTSERLARTVAFLQHYEPRPDVIIATGDLVDRGTAADYAQLTALLAPLDVPVLPIPGNHDARGAMRDAFPAVSRRAATRHLQYVVDDYDVRLIALDTLQDGRIGGLLCAERLDWIERALAQSSRPTLMFMHHPPYDSGTAPNLDMRCSGTEALESMVAAHGNVVGVVCGHLHRSTVVRWAGTIACTMPATAPMLELKLDGLHPSGWVDCPPMVGLHLWRPRIGLVSHALAVDEALHLHAFANKL